MMRMSDKKLPFLGGTTTGKVKGGNNKDAKEKTLAGF